MKNRRYLESLSLYPHSFLPDNGRASIMRVYKPLILVVAVMGSIIYLIMNVRVCTSIDSALYKLRICSFHKLPFEFMRVSEY